MTHLAYFPLKLSAAAQLRLFSSWHAHIVAYFPEAGIFSQRVYSILYVVGVFSD